MSSSSPKRSECWELSRPVEEQPQPPSTSDSGWPEVSPAVPLSVAAFSLSSESGVLPPSVTFSAPLSAMGSVASAVGFSAGFSAGSSAGFSTPGSKAEDLSKTHLPPSHLCSGGHWVSVRHLSMLLGQQTP